jgi:hypothetical protein
MNISLSGQAPHAETQPTPGFLWGDGWSPDLQVRKHGS